ncbi:recombination regulator RecX [Streptococcus ovuberis]|uniref:Regulatory protein RecX n=1 Tax=Streptococcus ovuberis TaxID=1936207 RepID=A0A7X6MXS1_9STRE|nr:recombination regulator RecX [Streptococcus ovuberis]NKZ19718.1 recombination regulator RecX [Streptococcus ovuberis]
MNITKLEKKKRLYLLELDETETLYITEDTLVRFMLTKGKTISDKELEEIKAFAQFSYGKNLALYHLSFKQRTTKEVRDYLIKHEIADTSISQIIDSLTADKWLDDARYAQQVIEANLHAGDKGPQVIKQKLLQKGLPLDLISQALEPVDFEATCQRVAEKLLRKYDGKYPIKGIKDKLLQGLMAKGFSYEPAKRAVADLALEEDEETLQELIFKELDKQYPKYSRKYEGYELKQRLTQALARKGFDFSDIGAALRDYL